MSDLLKHLRSDFQNEDARYAYVETHLNVSISAQIRHFRGALSQQELAEKIGTKQSGISRIENANYSGWKVETLRKLARAFGLRLRVTFEEFGTILPEIENFEESILNRRSFEDDPVFGEETAFKEGLNLQLIAAQPLAKAPILADPMREPEGNRAA